MENITNLEAYMQAILATVARQTFSVEDILGHVAIGSTAKKQIDAYNLRDGTRSQGEVAKQLKLDPGNFSKTVGRWIDAGILIRIGQGKELKPIHVYPLPAGAINLRKAKRK